MQENSQFFLDEKLRKIHLYSIITDVLRNWWVILLGALAVAMIANIAVKEQSHTNYSYTTSATFVVSAKGSSSSVYSDLASAQTMATTFSNVLNSGIMQKKVCEDLGLGSFDAKVTASVISETNLLVLTVTANSSKMAYQVIRSIMRNYSTITASMVGSTMLEVLKEPEVPTGSGGYVNTAGAMKKGFYFGVLVFVLLFAVLSYMNDTIKSSSDLADKLDAKALGTVYYERKYKSLRSWLQHKKSSILVTNTTASFGFVESYKKIAAKLTYMKQEGKGEIIVVTSILENEGKSTAAANIALSLAQNSGKVLLIDCDLRRPAQHLIFGKKKGACKDWTGLLNDKSILPDALRYDKERGIFTLLAAKSRSNSAELFSGNAMKEILQLFRDHFDYIVMDSPPMSVAADAEILADQVDMSVLIVRYNQVQARDINDAIDALSNCNSVMAGCILNQAKTMPSLNPSSYGYGYGYGGYYGYAKYGKGDNTKNE